MKQITVPVVFNQKVEIFMGKRKELLEAIFKHAKGQYDKEYIQKTVNDSVGTYWDLDKNTNLISMENEGTYTSQIRTLSHEAVHAADWIQNHLGIKDENGEFMAYCTDLIVGAGLKHIKK